MNLFSAGKEQLITMLIARVIIILLILPLHEFAHAWAARKCGDRTAEAAGRLTLNPFSHIDPIGAILLLVSGFGWAKPVPVNTRQMDNPKKGMILTSLAGPLSNLLVAFVGVVIFRVLSELTAFQGSGAAVIMMVLYFFITVNLGLAVFNLLPIPPLDGSNVILPFLPPKAIYWIQNYRQIISVVFMVLIFSDLLNLPLAFVSNALLRLFEFLTDWIPLLMHGIG